MSSSSSPISVARTPWNLQTYLQARYKSEFAVAFQCGYCGRYDTRMTQVHAGMYHPWCAAQVMLKLHEPLKTTSAPSISEVPLSSSPIEEE
ncbi:MAG: hypothetical protein Sylvanvirus37_2 [Sylvanvirus sp.]|uniref:Uncharacterized protein n=1 Tax=Sylvanvirus sp. TaxID=2487774 RepID=A0A3G5AJ51_9VIRU|nr:MAG: hypothetical protein Sylvanvirus37_2 [Sylvanvirus sp.]